MVIVGLNLVQKKGKVLRVTSPLVHGSGPTSSQISTGIKIYLFQGHYCFIVKDDCDNMISIPLSKSVKLISPPIDRVINIFDEVFGDSF